MTEDRTEVRYQFSIRFSALAASYLLVYHMCSSKVANALATYGDP